MFIREKERSGAVVDSDFTTLGSNFTTLGHVYGQAWDGLRSSEVVWTEESGFMGASWPGTPDEFLLPEPVLTELRRQIQDRSSHGFSWWRGIQWLVAPVTMPSPENYLLQLQGPRQLFTISLQEWSGGIRQRTLPCRTTLPSWTHLHPTSGMHKKLFW